MKKAKKEYNSLLEEMVTVDKYRELENATHHGISRLDHITRVGYLSFLLAKMLRLDVNTVTRGALLHDFFTEEDVEKYTRKEWHRLHPQIALENSRQYFSLNHVEENIIASHMFPICKTKPVYKESHVVATADKLVAVYEFARFNLFAYLFFKVLFFSVKA
jgi:uncharacterized protein